MFTHWKKREDLLRYLDTFSIEKWKSLPQSSKCLHTLSHCKECAKHHHTAQNIFPGRKFEYCGAIADSVSTAINESDMPTATTNVLNELQPLFQERFGSSFTEALTMVPGSTLQQKLSDVDKRRAKRSIQRECKEQVESHYKQTDTLTVLAEGMSMQSYKRLRLAQSFESPEAKRARANKPQLQKKHSPSFDETTWDKENVLEDLCSYSADTPINWSKFAREHNVPGKNAGQVVKEFAELSGIDTFQLDQREPGTRMRARKLKFTGQKVSVYQLTPPLNNSKTF